MHVLFRQTMNALMNFYGNFFRKFVTLQEQEVIIKEYYMKKLRDVFQINRVSFGLIGFIWIHVSKLVTISLKDR